jgi:hypothetical protein
LPKQQQPYVRRSKLLAWTGYYAALRRSRYSEDILEGIEQAPGAIARLPDPSLPFLIAKSRLIS